MPAAGSPPRAVHSKAISGSRQVYLYVDGKREATLFAQDIARKQVTSTSIPKFPILVTIRWSCAAHPLHTYGFQLAYPYEADKQVFTMYRVIERVPSTERLGILAIDMDMNFLSRISNQLFQPEHERCILRMKPVISCMPAMTRGLDSDFKRNGTTPSSSPARRKAISSITTKSICITISKHRSATGR